MIGIAERTGGVSELSLRQRVVRIFDLVERLVELLENGGIPSRRWLNLEQAAIYCGFSDPDPKNADSRHRAFLKFCRDEEIPYKPGNRGKSKYKMLFDVVRLNEAMERNNRKVMV